MMRQLRGLLGWSLGFVLLALGWAWYTGSGVPNVYWLHIFKHKFALYDYTGAWVALGCVVGGLFAVGKHAWVDAVVCYIGDRAWLVIALAGLFFAVGALSVYHAHPMSMDEYAPWFQAHAFAEGRLTGQFPPGQVPRFVAPFFIKMFFTASLKTGQIASKYWPGFALLMAPFAWLGLPWLLNPLLGVGSLCLLRFLCLRLFEDKRAVGWALLFALASPAFVFNAMSYYSMNAHLFMNLLFAALLLRPTFGRALLAGVVGSWALVLHNPFPHTVFAIPWLLWLLREHRKALVGALLGYIPLLLVLGLGWVLLLKGLSDLPKVGTSHLSSSMLSSSEFRSIFSFPTLHILNNRLIGFFKIVLWAVPCLPFVVLMRWKEHQERVHLRLLLESVLLTFVAYLFVKMDQGHGWGYRYFHTAWGALPVLAAASMLSVHEASLFRLKQAVMVMCLLSLVCLNGLRARQIEQFMTRHLAQLPPLDRSKRQICFLQARRGYYAQDLIQNHPLLKNPTWIVTSFGRAKDARWVKKNFPRARLVKVYRLGTVWSLEGDRSPVRKRKAKSRRARGQPLPGSARPVVRRPGPKRAVVPPRPAPRAAPASQKSVLRRVPVSRRSATSRRTPRRVPVLRRSPASRSAPASRAAVRRRAMLPPSRAASR